MNVFAMDCTSLYSGVFYWWLKIYAKAGWDPITYVSISDAHETSNHLSESQYTLYVGIALTCKKFLTAVTTTGIRALPSEATKTAIAHCKCFMVT